MLANAEANSFVIKDFTSPQESTFMLGGPGVTVWGFHETRGDYYKVKANPGEYVQVINVDIPAYLPIENSVELDVVFDGIKFKLLHFTKSRGEEYYSTLDSSKLPYFSSLRFFGDVYLEPDAIPPHDKFSYKLIVDTLHKFNSLLDDENKLIIDDDLHFSYNVLYFPKVGFPNTKPVVKTTYPYTGPIKVKSPNTLEPVNTRMLGKILTEKIRIVAFGEEELEPKAIGKDFSEKIFLLVHDFAFYCSQHPESLQALHEEHLRDLFLILAKSIFENVDSETFHFDGKLDFKIVNVLNKYEFVTGEFKWWNGENSFREAFHQAIRKHATGQEEGIYIVMLSKRKSANDVFEKIKTLVQLESEYIRMITSDFIPSKSTQNFMRCYVKNRDNETILTIGVIDCYYERK